MTTWAQARAALIAVALLVNGLLALPLPKSVKRSSFDTPIAKEELDNWVDLLAVAGVRTTRDALADHLTAYGKQTSALRSALVKPMKPWMRVSGTGQAWGLFTYPDTFPHRLVIEGRPSATAPWQTIFAGLDPEHDFLASVFTYRRVRGVYDGNTDKPGSSWRNFTKWAADRVFEAYPEHQEVQVGFVRFHTVAPGGTPDPTVTRRHFRTHLREPAE
jgi:hypothetical protein